MDSIPVNSQTPPYYWELLSLCQDFLQWDQSNSLDYEATELHNAVMIPGREGAAWWKCLIRCPLLELVLLSHSALSCLPGNAPPNQEFTIMAKAHFFQDMPHANLSFVDCAASAPSSFFWHNKHCNSVWFLLSSIDTAWLWQTHQQNQPNQPTMGLFPLISSEFLPYFFFLSGYYFYGNMKGLLCLLFLRI